jgi:hypothetical protein
MVNLINHSSKRANVKLQWSSVNQQHALLSLEELYQINTNSASSAGGLLLELVALRDVQSGEEILLDYGSTWQTYWDNHMEHWRPARDPYIPASVWDDAISMLATQQEILSESKGGGYPPNVITSCFYRYEQAQQQQPLSTTHNENHAAKAKDITTDEWKHFKGIYELRNLRPCNVLQRHEADRTNRGYYYTVVIRNRYGLTPMERIPMGHMHIVTEVPRKAIRFSDKIYTTDQHLEGAFRQEIGLADELFPSQWMDLMTTA